MCWCQKEPTLTHCSSDACSVALLVRERRELLSQVVAERARGRAWKRRAKLIRKKYRLELLREQLKVRAYKETMIVMVTQLAESVGAERQLAIDKDWDPKGKAS